MSTKERRRYPAGSLNLPIIGCPSWRAICLPMPTLFEGEDRAYSNLGAKVLYTEIKKLDNGTLYWIIIVDTKTCTDGVTEEMPEGWDYRNLR